ncbi:hypothetical protein NIE88_10510 [Sporolactobacillus shoreicorticis]|uniref:Uncharacterized protein n=1 Tax=Sporolactobacillus shoreicorticis TaxID=1923877 RepID=A0ABW5S6T4_9BACL|nr:hypothetical protein [Sporolactobacillus shoreicorticis]MCO7126207.1 hypothetical protein [Sporolactobacillus shoreicorticis]
MTSQKDMLAMASLEDRQKFYRNKALKLEQSMIFAKEEVAQLKKELSEKTAKTKDIDKNYEKLKNQLAALNKDYVALKQREQEIQKKLDTAEATIELLKQNQRAASDLSSDEYRHRVQGYERLLGEVQTEINDKNRRIEVYEKRLAILEHRLKNEHKKTEPIPAPSNDGHQQEKYGAISYINYVWILSGKKSLIQGDVLIENTGALSLDTPTICFRFHPGDIAALKGHVIHEEDAPLEQSEQEENVWVILDMEGGSEKNQSGEIWVRPSDPIIINPGQSTAFTNFQIPVDHSYLDSVRIECFVFFGDDVYKVKCGNEIVVNTSFHEQKSDID